MVTQQIGVPQPWVITSVTFFVFYIEALFHYNIGKPEEDFHLPNYQETLHIILVLLFFSLVNTWIIECITTM